MLVHGFIRKGCARNLLYKTDTLKKRRFYPQSLFGTVRKAQARTFYSLNKHV